MVRVAVAYRNAGYGEPVLIAREEPVAHVMAALGLGVDLKVLGTVGVRVTLAVTLSLLVLLAISRGLIRLLGIA